MYRICMIGEPFMRILVQKTDILERISEVLLLPFDKLSPVIQRTAAATLATLFKPESNRPWYGADLITAGATRLTRCRFVAYEARMFEACTSNYEVAHHLGPVLLASAKRR